MTLKEIINQITEKDYSFQVSAPTINFVGDKITVEKASSEKGSVENYINEIATTHNVNCLIVRSFRPHGSTVKQVSECIILLNNGGFNSEVTRKVTEEQRGSNEEVTEEQRGNNEEATSILKGITGEFPKAQVIIPKKHTTMQDKDYIDFKVLELTHDTLKNQFEEGKAKIVKLEKKVEDLHEENKKLLRDNLTKEDKHELALERVKLEHEKNASEQKESLSGVIGDAIKDPDMLKMIVGFINPKHPMFEKEPQAQLTGADDANREIQYTQNSDMNRILNDIPRVLSQKDGDTLTKVYLLFQKFVTSPEILAQATKQFVPELTN